MDRSTLWPIVKLSRRREAQLSVNISRRIAKSSSICIKTNVAKNDIFSQLIYLTKHASPYPRLAQGNSPSPAHS